METSKWLRSIPLRAESGSSADSRSSAMSKTTMQSFTYEHPVQSHGLDLRADTDQTYGSLVPDSARYTPPELARSGWDAIKKSPHSVVDSYDFGILIFEVFNGSFLGPDQAGQTKGIPPSMHSSYKRLVNANPKARLSVAHFLEQGRRSGAFFDTPLIKLTDGVCWCSRKKLREELQLCRAFRRETGESMGRSRRSRLTPWSRRVS